MYRILKYIFSMVIHQTYGNMLFFVTFSQHAQSEKIK